MNCKTITRTLLLMLLLVAAYSCSNKTNKDVPNKEANESVVSADTTVFSDIDTLIQANMKYYNFDEVKDLKHLFDSIADKHVLGRWSEYDDDPVEMVKECVARIDAYRKGEAVFYPDSLVHSCLRHMGYEAAILSNHGVVCTDLVLPEWFMMCAAFYAPDITCLVNSQTPDHCAGFYNFGDEYNSAPWWAYAFIKRKKGYEAIRLGSETKVRSVFQLEDKQHRKYYLYSDNLTTIEFHQWLFAKKDDGSYVKVAECDKAPQIKDIDFDEYYFDKNNLVWKYAKLKGYPNDLVAVDAPPALTLVLNGMNSCFK